VTDGLAGLFRPANPLEDALAASVRAGSPEALLPVLAGSDVFLPAPEAPEREVERVARPGDELPVPFLEHEGRRYVPVFTSSEQLLRFAPAGGPYLRLPGRALAALCPPGCPVVVNPGGELGCVLEPEDVARLAEAPAADDSLAVGEPQEEPVELLAALRGFGERTPGVEALYRAVVKRAGAAPELLVGLVLQEGADERAIVTGAAEVAGAAGFDSLALLPLRGAGDEPLARFLLERTTPFYCR
jgi:hypothetical protein